MAISRDVLVSSTGFIAGSKVVYSNVLEANSGVRIGGEIPLDADIFDEDFSVASLFASVVAAGEEIYLTGENGEEICAAEFELFVIVVSGSNGVFNTDYRVFALEEIEENI